MWRPDDDFAGRRDLDKMVWIFRAENRELLVIHAIILADQIWRTRPIPMEKLLGGVSRFQKHVYPEHQDLFEELALGQRPSALFITCADSRIDPCLLTQTQPGELFICRVIGNVVPPYPEALGGVSATVEYAVGVLRVPEVIICGHTDCGVMRGALHPEALEGFPLVADWLRYADVEHREAKPTPELLLTMAEHNVVTQLKNLRSHPAVKARLEKADLTLHGWVYHIGSGAVTAYDEENQKFLEPAAI
jgi:carbonic anhydrase